MVPERFIFLKDLYLYLCRERGIYICRYIILITPTSALLRLGSGQTNTHIFSRDLALPNRGKTTQTLYSLSP